MSEAKFYTVPGSRVRVVMRNLGGGKWVSLIVKPGQSADQALADLTATESQFDRGPLSDEPTAR